MKNILIALSLLFSISVAAQEYDEEDYYSRSTKEIEIEDQTGFYQKQGAITVNLNNNLILTGKAHSIPITLQIDYSTGKNFSVGPLFTYLKYKSNYRQSENTIVYTNTKVKYHQLVAGVKGSYHIMPMLEEFLNKKLPKHLLDVYITGWVGYSFISAKGKGLDQSIIDDNTTVRGGIGLGVRSMILSRFGFFIEGGYSSFAYGSFGMSFLVTKP